MSNYSTLIDIFFKILPFIIFFIAVKRRMIRSTTLLFLNKLVIQVLMTICIKSVHLGFKLLISGKVFSLYGYFEKIQEDLFPSVRIIIYLMSILHSKNFYFTVFSLCGIYSRVHFNHISVPHLLMIIGTMILMEIIGRKTVYLRDEDRYSYKCTKKRLLDVPGYKFMNIDKERYGGSYVK
ncbi:hypothetical protein CDIK_0110 [Cucumispora dikerogammari]|nr:hypothetical protein CDIK_0110 [Cucumispora dikerogammari]